MAVHQQSKDGLSRKHSEAERKLEMKLERIFVEAVREHVNFQLKSQFTTSNKKVQKRKIKKLKER